MVKRHGLYLVVLTRGHIHFNCLYKFPAEIYNQDRRDYLSKLIKKNKLKDKQTRATYHVSITKSIKLCEKFNKNYYVWKRNTKDN